MHVCPMLNPGTPPPPHVGGPILPPGAPLVLIGGQPAACVGDMLTCAGPPDSIAPPGCPTVLIGTGGSAGAGGGASSDAKGAEASAAAASATSVGEYDPGRQSGSDQETPGHYVNVAFLDKAGFPVSELGYRAVTPDGATLFGRTAGGVKATLDNSGDTEIELFGITKIGWSASRVKVGSDVTMQVQTCGLGPGTKATMELFVRDRNFAPFLIKRWEVTVVNNSVVETWHAESDALAAEEQEQVAEAGGYTCPYYYFAITVNNYTARSAPLMLIDDVKIKLTTEKSVALANSAYRLHLCNGEVRQGKLDTGGCAEIKDVIAGRHEFVFTKVEDPKLTDNN
jgi:uncharacterized Zn-binding protein involved in type VI secretion